LDGTKLKHSVQEAETLLEIAGLPKGRALMQDFSL
jgi:hypothetical protein